MDFDIIRAEKEEAMRRYNRRRNLRTFACIATLFSLLVLLFSWSSPQIPAAMAIVREFSPSFKPVLCKIYVFLLMNALILAIHFSNHENADVAKPDVYDEYLSKSKSASVAAGLRFPPSKIVNGNPYSPAKRIRKTKSALVVIKECPAPLKEGEIRVTETGRRHRRSQSESFERQAVAARELRRSETQNGRETAERKQSMEEMSSEEFRITVESFIAKKKRDLREQHINMLHSPSGVAEP